MIKGRVLNAKCITAAGSNPSAACRGLLFLLKASWQVRGPMEKKSWFTRYIWETVGFLSTTNVFCLVWPESECYISFKQIPAKMTEKAPFTLKLWSRIKLRLSVKWKTSNRRIHLWKRRGEMTATQRHAANKPTTKSGRCDQRGCRVVWLLFNEPSGSFQSKRESLLSGSDHFKNKGSLLSSRVHITGLHCARSQSSHCSPCDNNKRLPCTHKTHTWALMDIT